MTLLRRAVYGAGAEPVVAVGAHNAVAARLIEEAGYGCLWVSSLELSAVRGLPDRNVLGAWEMADHVSLLRQVSGLPIIADIDNAQGSPAMGERLGRELSLRGCDGVCVEDNAFPKANSFSALDTHELCSPEVMAVVIQSLKEGAAARGQCLTVIARTEALIAGLPVSAALDRMAFFRDAGADIVIAHSKDSTGQEALAVAAAWDGSAPLGCIPTAYPHLRLQDLRAAGYRLCIFANHLLRASVASMQQVLADALTDGRFRPTLGIVTIQRLFTLTDAGTLCSIEAGEDAAAESERLNVMEDIAAFVARWDAPYGAPIPDTVKVNEWGNRNTSGQPGQYTAPDFTPHDPQFSEAIEPGIRLIVLQVVAEGFITFTSCEGHLYPPQLSLDPIERSVGVLPRSELERRAVRSWFAAAAAACVQDDAVRVDVRDEVLSDERGRRVETVDLVFEPKSDWQRYFAAIEHVTGDMHQCLADAADDFTTWRRAGPDHLDQVTEAAGG